MAETRKGGRGLMAATECVCVCEKTISFKIEKAGEEMSNFETCPFLTLGRLTLSMTATTPSKRKKERKKNDNK